MKGLLKGHRLDLFLLCAGLMLVFQQGLFCQTLLRLQRHVMVKRAMALDSYSGELLENGTAAGQLRYRIHARRPASFSSEVVSPGPYQGVRTVYHERTLRAYFPASKFGYEFKNVPPLTPAEEGAYLRANFDWYTRTYNPRLRNKQRIAGYMTTRVNYPPRSKRPYLYYSFAWLEERYAFPLATRILDGKDELYSSEWREILFNRKSPAAAFRFEFPAGANVARWDLAARAYTATEARAAAPHLRFALPVVRDLRLEKLVRLAGIVPGFTAVYRRSPYYLYCAMVKDLGLPLHEGPAVTIQGRHRYRLRFAPINTGVDFNAGGVRYTLVSNLPYPELLALADTIAAP